MQRLPRSRHTTTLRGLVAAAALLAAPAVFAHAGHEASDGGFVGGLVHPFTGFDHLLVMLGVGMWSAMLGKKAWPDLLWAPLAFVALLAVGALIGVVGVSPPLVEPIIAASLLVVGLLVAARARMPALAAAAVVGTFAVFHGIAHGHELARAGIGTGNAIAGMALATALLHAAGITLGWMLLRTQRKVAMTRLAGGAIAVFGVAVMAGLPIV